MTADAGTSPPNTDEEAIPALHQSIDHEEENDAGELGDSGRILLCGSEFVQVYREGNEVVKVPNNSLCDGVNEARLGNEYHILRRLTDGLSDGRFEDLSVGWHVRGAISLSPLRLEWAEGSTLRDWMVRNPPPRRKASTTHEGGDEPWKSAAVVANIMLQMSAAVAALHAAGVVHNHLTPDHIIVNEDCDGGLLSHVTIIGLGDAEVISSLEKDDTGEIANDDLYQLGLIFQGMIDPGEALYDKHELSLIGEESTRGVADAFQNSFSESPQDSHLGFNRSTSFKNVAGSFWASVTTQSQRIFTDQKPGALGQGFTSEEKIEKEKQTPLQVLQDIMGAMARCPGAPTDKYKSPADIEAELFFSVLPYIRSV
mmetsp:Transcript_9713/g.20539  ORF Transcript_9713/g.20539 Transcript_9713/m.20539 type:complete len:370 (-) Transcript_9713:95-1204(-)